MRTITVGDTEYCPQQVLRHEGEWWRWSITLPFDTEQEVIDAILAEYTVPHRYGVHGYASEPVVLREEGQVIIWQQGGVDI